MAVTQSMAFAPSVPWEEVSLRWCRPQLSNPREIRGWTKLVYPSGLTAQFISSFTVPEMDFTMRITGSNGEAFAYNFCVAAIDDRIDVTVDGYTRTEEMGKKSTYTYQLEAFADHIRNDAPIYTDAQDALVQAEFIDAVYSAAGLPLRPSSAI